MEKSSSGMKREGVVDLEENEKGNKIVFEQIERSLLTPKLRTLCSSREDNRWIGESDGRIGKGEAFNKLVTIDRDAIDVGFPLLVETKNSAEYTHIYFVKHIFDDLDGNQLVHER